MTKPDVDYKLIYLEKIDMILVSSTITFYKG